MWFKQVLDYKSVKSAKSKAVQLLLFLITVFYSGSTIQAAADTLGQSRYTLVRTYKTIDTIRLQLSICKPAGFSPNKLYPSIVFFHGGGWNRAHRDQFLPQAKYLAEQGMVAILADYRVRSVHGTTPFDALDDARSAIRYVKIHARELGVDTGKLVAAGGSAGGQLAAACDLIDPGVPCRGELRVDARPKALVLFNPVINNGPGQFGYDRITERFKEISPYHNISKGAAPSLIFSGEEDKTVGPEVIRAYQKCMELHGVRCDIHLYEGQVHGFYGYREDGDNVIFYDTMAKVLAFLRSLSILPNQHQELTDKTMKTITSGDSVEACHGASYPRSTTKHIS